MGSDRKIDHEWTDEIVCPYCGYEFDCSYESLEPDESDDIACNRCDEVFHAESDMTIRYTTSKERGLDG